MIRFKEFVQFITEMAAKREGATLSNFDSGVMYELTLGQALNNHPEVGRGNKLPRHWRSFNEDYAGTPAQVHGKLVKKAGRGSNETRQIRDLAIKNTSNIIDSLKESGHLGKTETNGVKHPPTKITNVFWTSNRDQVKEQKPIEGDHQRTTGHHDPNSKADLMVTIAPRHEEGHHGEHHPHYVDGHGAGVRALVASRRAESEGKPFTPPTNPHPRGSKQHRVWAEGYSHGQLARHVGISAKLANNPINYENAGYDSMEQKTKSKGLAKILNDEMRASDEKIAKKHGYAVYKTKKDGTKEFNAAASSENFKQDRAVYEAEEAAHNAANKQRKANKQPTLPFVPKSAAAKRAHNAYQMANASLRTGIRNVANALRGSSQDHLRSFILNAVVPRTRNPTIIAHSNRKTNKSAVHSEEYYRNHLEEYDNLEAQHGSDEEEGGTNLYIYGTHKKTGERKPIFTLNHKTNSGAMGPRQFGVRMPQIK